jgi:hypothetical protein
MDLDEEGLSFGKFVTYSIESFLTYVYQMGDILAEVLMGYPQASIEVQGLMKVPHSTCRILLVRQKYTLQTLD